MYHTSTTKKVKIQHFLGCLPPKFRERIEFDMPKTLDTTLQKSRMFYEHGHLRKENMNINKDKSKNFFDKKVKECHVLRMGSITMVSFINIFLDPLHYVPYIKDEKVKIQ